MRAVTLGVAAVSMILVAGCGKKDADDVNTSAATTSTMSTAANPDAPAPGLWAVTTKVAGQAAPTVQICLGETPVGTNAFMPANSGNCTGAAPTKTATGYEFASECTANGATAKMKGSVSGDMATNFTVNLMVNAGGKEMGTETTYSRVGDCPAGTAPGATVTNVQ